MKNLKFELIIPYYKRPEIVLNALDSVLKSNYKNWHLSFIDDSGDNSFEKTFLNFGLDKSKITYIPILMKDEEKIKIGNSIFGKYVNEAIIKTDADIVILICDDDALLPDYMENLNKFYLENPNVMYAYCHLKFFDPEVEKYTDAKEDSSNFLNNYTGPIMGVNNIDSSQVSFRKEAFICKNIWFPHPYTISLDAYVLGSMYNGWGPCHFIGSKGQCKGIFPNMLGKRISNSSIYI
jgi:glycosyltransferase involved in cell wall biosynthesis